MKDTELQEKLIEAVKKRPLIYSKYHPQFANRKVKFAMWHEVCNEVIPEWKELSSGQKGEKLCEIQRRWKTLRDGFSRELHFAKRHKQKIERGEVVRKRRRYAYYQQLKFLLKEKKRINDDAEEEESSSEEEMDSSNTDDNSQDFKTEPETTFYADVENNAEPIIEHREFETAKEEDEDKLFCLSLVQSFKKMTDKQKFDARIAIMKVVSDIRFSTENTQSQAIP